MLNVVPTLAYEEVNPSVEMYQERSSQQFSQMGRNRGRSTEPRNKDEAPLYYIYRHSYSHSTADCSDVTLHSQPDNQMRYRCSRGDASPLRQS